MKKRILSVFLAMLMVLGSVGTFAIASTAAEYEKFTIAVECGEITDEGTVHVDIVMYNNPGLSSAVFSLDFDETVLKLVDYDKKSATSKSPKSCLTEGSVTTNLTKKDITEVAYTYIFAGIDAADGVLLGLTFEVAADFVSTDLTIVPAASNPFTAQEDEESEMTYPKPDLVHGKIALPEITGVTFANGEFTYDGTAKSLAVSGAEGMDVVYSGNGQVNQGEHKVTALVTKIGYQALELEATLKINPKEVTISGVTVADKVFDGETTVEIDDTNAVVNGVVAGDSLTVEFPATGTVETAAAGANKAVTYGDITVTGNEKGNYKVVKPALAANVKYLEITITPMPNQSKTVGEEDPAFQFTSSVDVAKYGKFVGALEREPGEEEGTYKFNLGTLSFNNANIKIVGITDEVFTINVKPKQNVSVTEPTGAYTFDPDNNPTFDIGVTVNEGNTTATPTFTSSNTNVVTVDADGKVTVVGAGEAYVTVTVAGNDDFATFNKNVMFTVAPKTVTVTPVVPTTTITYGDDVEIDFNADFEHDTLKITGNPTFTMAAGEQSITKGDLAIANTNYKLVFVEGTTVNVLPKTVKLNGVEMWPALEGETPEIKSYGAYVDSADFVDGDEVNVVTGALGVEYDNSTDAWYVTGVGVDNDNYVLDTEVNVDFYSAAELPEELADEFDGESAELPAGTTKIDTSDMALPHGYTAVIIGSSNADVIDEEGNVKASSSEESVTLTLEILDPNGDPTGATFTTTLTVPAKKNSSYLQALLMYYYYKNNNMEQVKSVTANVATGEVEAGTKVTLTTDTAGATIYYTLNGSTPTVLSTVYTGPITVNSTVTITAIAAKNGMITSAPVSFKYIVDGTSITLKADAADIKYMDGRGDKFEPTADATRYEVVKALANIFDIVPGGEAKALTDVADEYKAVVDLFTAAGIIDGYTDNTFRGDKTITRQEVAKIIAVMMNLDIENAEDAGFTDVSGWATDYINACANEGFVNGKGEGKFAPTANIKRGELAKLINNITGAKDGDSCSYADVDMTAWYGPAVAAAAK
ncbi:MAG: hypothetical protein E7671_01005 [Ruminococcaceae bacterium]|nr:hypothetical protein [Oscillospiraceae bacterium]